MGTAYWVGWLVEFLAAVGAFAATGSILEWIWLRKHAAIDPMENKSYRMMMLERQIAEQEADIAKPIEQVIEEIRVE